MANREKLVREFTELRNSLVTRPASSNTRLRNLYLDHLNDTDALARMKSDAELEKAIAELKRRTA